MTSATGSSGKHTDSHRLEQMSSFMEELIQTPPETFTDLVWILFDGGGIEPSLPGIHRDIK